MRRSKDGRGKSLYGEFGVWRRPGGSIHLTLKDAAGKSRHLAVNADPSRRNGHPTLYAALEQCLLSAGIAEQ